MRHLQQAKPAKLTLLFLLYLSQGLPFGFQVTALPVYLRTRGISLTLIGFSGALALPWAVKAFYAPVVDRFYSSRVGRRKSWIIPMQLLLIGSFLFSAYVADASRIEWLLFAIFLMNFFAATQDIAVDGLAVDILNPEDLGPGNAAQVIGYKAGMVISGGLLVYLSAYTGWEGLFYVMIFFATLPFFLLFFIKEPRTYENGGPAKPDLKHILKKTLSAMKIPGAAWFILFIATYKTGELMIDTMFKPFLIDSGFTASQIGLYVGTYGMAASLIGSFSGGLFAARYPLSRMLAISLLIRIFPLCMEWFLTIRPPTTGLVILTTLSEHFAGGMLTTIMFASMMRMVDKNIGATHYTILASIEVIGKSPGAWISGPIADAMGYSSLFFIGIVLSVMPLFLISQINEGITSDKNGR